LTIDVPAAVPSLTHHSAPWVGVVAATSSLPLTTLIAA
jgi:hypothetical protein